MEVESYQPIKMTTTSRGGVPSSNQQRHQKKKEVCERILSQLADIGHESVEKPGFAEELQAYFTRLPTRYFLAVETLYDCEVIFSDPSVQAKL